jgi:hypothetical protein
MHSFMRWSPALALVALSCAAPHQSPQKQATAERGISPPMAAPTSRLSGAPVVQPSPSARCPASPRRPSKWAPRSVKPTRFPCTQRTSLPLRLLRDREEGDRTRPQPRPAGAVRPGPLHVTLSPWLGRRLGRVRVATRPAISASERAFPVHGGCDGKMSARAMPSKLPSVFRKHGSLKQTNWRA